MSVHLCVCKSFLHFPQELSSELAKQREETGRLQKALAAETAAHAEGVKQSAHRVRFRDRLKGCLGMPRRCHCLCVQFQE